MFTAEARQRGQQSDAVQRTVELARRCSTGYIACEEHSKAKENFCALLPRVLPAVADQRAALRYWCACCFEASDMEGYEILMRALLKIPDEGKETLALSKEGPGEKYKRLVAMGTASARLLKWDAALECLQQSLDLFAQLPPISVGVLRWEAACLGVAEVWFDAGRTHAAQLRVQQLLLDVLKKHGENNFLAAEAHALLGEIFLTRRMFMRAHSHLRRSLAVWIHISARPISAVPVFYHLARLAAETGSLALALQYLDKTVASLPQPHLFATRETEPAPKRHITLANVISNIALIHLRMKDTAAMHAALERVAVTFGASAHQLQVQTAIIRQLSVPDLLRAVSKHMGVLDESLESGFVYFDCIWGRALDRACEPVGSSPFPPGYPLDPATVWLHASALPPQSVSLEQLF